MRLLTIDLDSVLGQLQNLAVIFLNWVWGFCLWIEDNTLLAILAWVVFASVFLVLLNVYFYLRSKQIFLAAYRGQLRSSY